MPRKLKMIFLNKNYFDLVFIFMHSLPNLPIGRLGFKCAKTKLIMNRNTRSNISARAEQNQTPQSPTHQPHDQTPNEPVSPAINEQSQKLNLAIQQILIG